MSHDISTREGLAAYRDRDRTSPGVAIAYTLAATLAVIALGFILAITALAVAP